MLDVTRIQQPDTAKPARYYEAALAFVVTQRRITPGGLQRRLVTGYALCESWLARMEAEGVVSGADEDGRRDVLARLH